MKLKFYLQGLGTGILFATIIMLAAYLTGGGYKLSDKEIKERAKKLGMVEATEAPASTEKATEATEKPTTENPVTEATTGAMTEKPTTEATTEATTEKPTTEATTEATTEKPTTETTTEATTEMPTTEATTEAPTTDNSRKKSVTVQSGMGSETVAALLQSAGIIDDAAAFDTYLNRNGYSTRIEVGTFYFDDNMTYEQIAKVLTRQ